MNTTLALKTVSLACLLLLSRMLLKHQLTRSCWRFGNEVLPYRMWWDWNVVLNIGTLPRDDDDAVLTKFVLTKSPVARILLFGVLMLLRPHLASFRC